MPAPNRQHSPGLSSLSRQVRRAEGSHHGGRPIEDKKKKKVAAKKVATAVDPSARAETSEAQGGSTRVTGTRKRSPVAAGKGDDRMGVQIGVKKRRASVGGLKTKTKQKKQA